MQTRRQYIVLACIVLRRTDVEQLRLNRRWNLKGAGRSKANRIEDCLSQIMNDIHDLHVQNKQLNL